MSSTVTKRIKEVKQPRGGYINPSQFNVIKSDDGITLSENENVHFSTIGMAVDYLTRYMIDGNRESAFVISLKGASVAESMGYEGAIDEAEKYLMKINGLDDISIVNACKLTSFDIWYRNPAAMPITRKIHMSPNKETICNIQVMMKRVREFWKDFGPVLQYGFTVDTEGYASIVKKGDGDYLTCDTIWDFKTSKNKPDKNATLQLLMYWIMGQHSKKPEFAGITRLGIFNPRLNFIYTLNISDISKDIIKTVETDVIGY